MCFVTICSVSCEYVMRHNKLWIVMKCAYTVTVMDGVFCVDMCVTYRCESHIDLTGVRLWLVNNTADTVVRDRRMK